MRLHALTGDERSAILAPRTAAPPRSARKSKPTKPGSARHKASLFGKSGDPSRGAYCTPAPWADRVGRFDVDPFTNPLSHIQADAECMLERGDNGIADRKVPGSYRINGIGEFIANAETRSWIQPPYDIVMDAIRHYGHTRFCALLRFDPRTKWFRVLYRLSRLICVIPNIQFEAPPGVDASVNMFPHALYYARVEDATPAVLRACFSWRT